MEFYEGVDFIKLCDCQWDEELKIGSPTLRDSLLQLGQMVPILVVNKETHFHVIDGVQRVKTMRKLGWKMVVARCISEEDAYGLAEAEARSLLHRRTLELVSGG